jgi:hypothetical protein
MTSAAFHASCLSHYLRAEPRLDTGATEFFRLQKVVVDVAWATSSDGDIERQDALDGVTVPPEVEARRDAIADVVAATMVDETLATAFNRVTMMLAQPDTLAAPELQARAAAAKAR